MNSEYMCKRIAITIVSTVNLVCTVLWHPWRSILPCSSEVRQDAHRDPPSISLSIFCLTGDPSFSRDLEAEEAGSWSPIPLPAKHWSYFMPSHGASSGNPRGGKAPSNVSLGAQRGSKVRLDWEEIDIPQNLPLEPPVELQRRTGTRSGSHLFLGKRWVT